MKKDNINERYKSFEKRPGSLKNALGNFNRITEETYAVFRDVVKDHSDIGKASIVIMASNLASHIVKVANDDSKPRLAGFMKLRESLRRCMRCFMTA